MKFSYNWLQKHIEEKLPTVESLKEIIIFKAFEVESIENINNDFILDIKVLPDRAHDCLSHAGMAREISGLLGLTFTTETLSTLPEIKLETKIEIQSDICRRYMATQIKGIKVGLSPQWLKESLESLGIRSINNVVDITNFILLDYGQPVHAYDADKIDSGIVVRFAHEDEQITTLSDEVKGLKKEDLVITDHLGPLAIAGIKGGRSAEITSTTTNIVIEVANFEPTNIRKTSKRLSLQTDASKRFENDISPELTVSAMNQAIALVKEFAGGEVTGVSDYYPKPQESKILSFSLSDITKLLGHSVSSKDIEQMLASYKYDFTKENENYIVSIPMTRLDITGAHDIAEEVGRYLGYDHIPIANLPIFETLTSSEYQNIINTKLWLAQNGFREVMNYSFVKKGDVYISHGTKDKSALRSNLSDGLKESYDKSKINNALLGLENIRIFEIGTIFLKDKEEMRVATCDKGVFEELLLTDFIKKYNIDTASTFNLGFSNPIPFKSWSVYPYITRDIAVWSNTLEAQQKLEEIVSGFAEKYCVRGPVLFDRFEKPASVGGDNRTSLAYRLVFQSYDKTLTEDEVEAWFNELTEKINQNKDFEIR